MSILVHDVLSFMVGPGLETLLPLIFTVQIDNS